MLNADLKEFEFTSEFDGLVLSAVIALPSGQINGVVQIIHGANEHKERYYPFMDYLAQEGFISVIHDNRGHGKSICQPDDLGFMFKNGGEGFLSDIVLLNRIIRETYPQYPLFMAAQGIGTAAARLFIRDHDNDINGLILLGIPVYSSFSPIVRAVNSASPQNDQGKRFRSEKIFDVIDNHLGKFFEQPDNSWRCSDPAVVEAFNNDPLCNFIYTLNGFEEMVWLLRSSTNNRGWKMNNPSLPIRFISGKDDPVMISEKKFQRELKRLEKHGYESISHRLFDGMRHDVLNENGSVNVWKDIAKSLFSWIDRINDSLPPQEEVPAAQENPPQQTD